MLKRTLIGLALTGACALGTLARPAAAQYQGPLYFTLSGVTFSDGAAATGSFEYNFFTSPPGSTACSITTTDGVSDALFGSQYTLNENSPQFLPVSAFSFTASGSSPNSLLLLIEGNPFVPGIYALAPGILYPPTGSTGSVEFISGITRTINSGDVIVSTASLAAVPEASTTVSFGLLLILGGGAVMARKKLLGTF